MNQPTMTQGPMYIKQMEDTLYPSQPYTSNGFPHNGRELRPAQYTTSSPNLVPKNIIFDDFLPFHKDFNRYIYNKKIGYVDRIATYPIYNSGFASSYR